MSRIVIYGGSFDPLHNGHKAIISELHNKFDEVYVVPAKYKDNMMFSDSARVSFIMEFISKCFHVSRKIHLICDELEDLTGELSKTLNLVKHIKNKYLRDGDEIYLCIGWDQYENLKNWYSYEELLKIVKLVVVNRSDMKFENLYSDLNENVMNLEIHGYEDLSSTNIRNQIHDYVILN